MIFFTFASQRICSQEPYACFFECAAECAFFLSSASQEVFVPWLEKDRNCVLMAL